MIAGRARTGAGGGQLRPSRVRSGQPRFSTQPVPQDHESDEAAVPPHELVSPRGLGGPAAFDAARAKRSRRCLPQQEGEHQLTAMLPRPPEPANLPQENGFGVHRPSRRTTVITATGELDGPAAPRFSELIAAELSSAVDALVIDWSQLEFVCLDAVDALREAEARARGRGVVLRVVTGPACVRSGLRAAGLHEVLDARTSRNAALVDLP